MPTKITVVLCTKRKEPRLDWAFEGLKNQTFKDFEYIIVDGYWQYRKDYVRDLCKRSGILNRVTHIPDKPSRWKGKRPALSNARNTALIFADGENIVFHDDNCKIPPDWLERHYKWLSQGDVVAGNWCSYESEGVVGPYGWEHRNKIKKEPGTVSGGWLYGGNFSFPLGVGININGFEEELDGELGQDDLNFGIRAERKGYKIMYDPGCSLEYIISSHKLLMSYESDYWKGKELEEGTNFEPKKRTLGDGKKHFSNEWHTQKLLKDSRRYLPYGNCFSLAEVRYILRAIGGCVSINYCGDNIENNIQRFYKELEKYTDLNKYDWRDGQEIREMVGR